MMRTSHVDRLVAAQRHEGFLLNHLQQLGLQGQRDFPDFIQEDGAVPGGFEFSLALGVGAGERPLFVAEQFALQQLLGQGRAIDGDEGSVFPIAPAVDHSRDPAFSRPAFPFQEHRGIRFRGALNHSEHPFHGRTHPDHLLVLHHLADFFFQGPVFLLHIQPFAGPPDDDLHLVHFGRLGHIVEGARFHRGDGALHIAVGRHDHKELVGIPGDEFLQQFDSRRIRQPEIEKDDPGVGVPQLGPGFFSGRGGVDDKALFGEVGGQDAQQLRLVVDKQQ